MWLILTGPVPKKRKVEDPKDPKAAAPGKTAARPGAATNTKPAPAAKPAVKTVTDMSFFDTSVGPPPIPPSKAKRVLPSIKKNVPPPVVPPPAESSSSSLLANAFKKFLHKPAPAAGGVEVADEPVVKRFSVDVSTETKTSKANKKGHVVRFRDAVPHSGTLVEIRVFEQPEFETVVPPWIVAVSWSCCGMKVADETRRKYMVRAHMIWTRRRARRCSRTRRWRRSLLGMSLRVSSRIHRCWAVLIWEITWIMSSYRS
jgi:hypothetical protein